MKALQAQIIQQVDDCYVQAEQRLNRKFIRPNVNFKQRGKIAGSAHLVKNELRFNAKLLQDNMSQFMNEVVQHEIAHLLCFQLFGRVQPHGKQWKKLMKDVFDLVGTRCHQMDTKEVEGQTFTYHCGCGDMQLSIRRHNKVVRGEQQYQCKQCRQILSRTLNH